MRRDAPVAVSGLSTTGASSRHRLLEAAAVLEVSLAVVAVVLDLLVPTLVLLAMAMASITVRRQSLASLGLRRPAHAGAMAAQVLGLSLFWTALTSALVMPVSEHLSGQRQDLGVFADVEGNLALLGVLLIASWTLAAIGEEVAYRGYLLTRLRELLPGGRAWTVVAAVVAAVLFGWPHREYGVVGVVQVTVDALFFTVLRFRYRTLWAAVVAHGTVDTVGIVAVFLAGPVAALW